MLANAVIRNDEAAIIRQASECTKLVLDASPMGITLWSDSIKVIDCNDAAAVLLGAENKKALLEKRPFYHSGCRLLEVYR